MSKHVFTVAVELTAGDNDSTKQVLKAIGERITINVTDEFGITGYEDGKPVGLGGLEGPLVTGVVVEL